MAENSNTLLPRVKQMAVGDVLVVRVEDYAYNTVRRYACDLGLTLQRKYSVKLDRAARTYTVTRHS